MKNINTAITTKNSFRLFLVMNEYNNPPNGFREIITINSKRRIITIGLKKALS